MFKAASGLITLQPPRQEVLSPHSAQQTAFRAVKRTDYTTVLPLRSSKQQHLVLKTDTEYRRWYNKGKKSGASSFFENQGQLLRRFGNEHDYGGDE